MTPTPLYLDWNLGLGDSIVCNGLVRWLARDGRIIYVPAWERNLPTVRHMFSDLPHVHVVTADGDKPGDHPSFEVLSIGVNNPKWGSFEPWDEAFYRFAGVLFDAKWDLFHVPESGTEIPASKTPSRFDGRPYALVHEDAERGFTLTYERDPEQLREVEVTPVTRLLTDWRNVIRDAAEIHVIDSAPMHLAELLPTTGKLFYHKYARALGNRNHRDATFRKPWTVLE